jgi:tyrosine-protein kinase Etk/Wzc
VTYSITEHNGNGVSAGTPATPPFVPLQAPPAAKGEDLLTPRGLWNLMRRRKWLVLGSTLGIMALVGALCIVLTPVYETVTQVRVLDTHVDLPDLFAHTLNDREVTTEMAVLSSRKLADATIDSMRLRAIVSPKRVLRSSLLPGLTLNPGVDTATYILTKNDSSPTFTIVDDETKKTLGTVAVGGQIAVPGFNATLGPAAAEQHRIKVEILAPFDAYKQFDKHMKVDRPVRDANVITLTYKGKDPELARDVPNVLAGLYIADRQTQEKTQARSTVKVLRQQLDSLSHELTTSETALQAFREKNNVVSLPDEATSQVQQYALMQADRQGIDAEAQSLSALMAQVGLQAAQQKPDQPSPYRRLLAFPTLLKNPAATELLHSLATVDDERTALLTRRTPKDPDVLVLTDREHQLEDQVKGIATTYLQGLQNQRASLDNSLAQYSQRMSKIPAKEVEFARLSRQPKVLDTIYTQLQTRLKEAQVKEAVDDPSLQLMDPAVLPVEPIRPKPLLWMAASLFLGLLVGVGSAAAKDSGDYTVHTRADVLAATGAPVLGMIPRISGDALMTRIRFAHELGEPEGSAGHGRRRITPRQRKALDATNGDHGLADGGAPVGSGVVLADPGARSAVAEAYSRLQTNLAYLRADRTMGLKAVVLTSPLSGDGKTTSAVNLAVTLVRRGHRVLLVDADLRRGVINRIFGASRSPGLADVLEGTTTIDQAVRGVSLGRGTTLHYLPTGTLPQHPAALLDSPALASLLEKLKDQYDTVILDSPPINIVTDASLLAAHADGVLVVARSGVTAAQALSYAMEQLRHVRAPVLGAVLNDIDFARDSAYDGSYKFQGYRDRYYTIHA